VKANSCTLYVGAPVRIFALVSTGCVWSCMLHSKMCSVSYCSDVCGTDRDVSSSISAVSPQCALLCSQSTCSAVYRWSKWRQRQARSNSCNQQIQRVRITR